MKKNLLAFSAVVLTILLSSFTVRVDTTYYLEYDGSGIEKSKSNYITPYATTQPFHNSGTGRLNWFKVVDVNSNGISTTEFNNAFDSYDITDPTGDLLSDESDVNGELDVEL